MKRLPVKCYEGVYEVAEDGTIFSLARIVKRAGPIGDYRVKGRPLRIKMVGPGYYKGSGYAAVNLTKRKKMRTLSVHRIVALHFIPNPHGYKEVNHKDGDKLNNHVSNLEWCTKSQNTKHAYDTGLRKQRSGQGSKFTKEQVEQMRRLSDAGVKTSGIARNFGVGYTTIWRILNKKRWK